MLNNSQIPNWLTFDKQLTSYLQSSTRQWLVTGVAGFIGSNILEALLLNGQRVRGLDNFSTGHKRNLEEVEARVGPDKWKRFDFQEGDIRNPEHCDRITKGVEHVLHQAALGSVPRSIHDPITTNNVNVGGFLNILDSARRLGVKTMVYAASSSTYGDEPNLPKIEQRIGKPLSPYAVTKLVNEQYAEVYNRVYDFKATGLRYFNVFGPRQDPGGAYAAVIPIWAAKMIRQEEIKINGDGSTSRDYCFVTNAVQANIRAALVEDCSQGEVYNVAVGDRTTLITLFETLKRSLQENQMSYVKTPDFGDFRIGDVLHSQADVSKASMKIGYRPEYAVDEGIAITIPWYLEHLEYKAK